MTLTRDQAWQLIRKDIARTADETTTLAEWLTTTAQEQEMPVEVQGDLYKVGGFNDFGPLTQAAQGLYNFTT